MIISENITTVDDVKKYYRFHFFKVNKIAGVVILVLVEVALFCIMGVNLLKINDLIPFFFFPVFLIGAVFTITKRFYCILIAPQRNFYKYEDIYSIKKRIVFDEVGIAIYIDSDELNEKSALKYGMIIQAYETRDCFYLYTDKVDVQVAYIIPKISLIQGSVQELSELLEEKLCGKFMRK